MGERLCDRDHFVTTGIGSRHEISCLISMPVEAASAETDCACLKSFFSDATHLLHVFSCGVVVTAFTHNEVSYSYVWCLSRNIDCVRGVNGVEVFGERLPPPWDAFV